MFKKIKIFKDNNRIYVNEIYRAEKFEKKKIRRRKMFDRIIMSCVIAVVFEKKSPPVKHRKYYHFCTYI